MNHIHPITPFSARFRVELCDNVGVVDSFDVHGPSSMVAWALCEVLNNKWSALVFPNDVIRVVSLEGPK